MRKFSSKTLIRAIVLVIVLAQVLALPILASAATVQRVTTFNTGFTGSEVYLNRFDLRSAELTINNSKFVRTNSWSYIAGNGSGEHISADAIVLREAISGTTQVYTNPFSVKFKNAGYTNTGDPVDFKIDFTRVERYARTRTPVRDRHVIMTVPTGAGGSYIGDCLSFSAYNQAGTDLTGPGASDPGARYDATFTIYKAGTSTALNLSSQVLIKDIDRNDLKAERAAAGSGYSTSNPYVEGIRFVSGFADTFYLASNSFVQTTLSNTRFTASTVTEDYDIRGWVLGTMLGASASIQWSGSNCETFFFGRQGYLKPPNVKPPKISKVANTPSCNFDSSTAITYTIRVDDIPFFLEQAWAYPSLTVSDELVSCFDLSRTTLKVYDANGVEKTNDWVVAKSGQTISAKMSGQANTVKVFGDYTFVISTYLDITRDMSAFEKTEDGWKIPNTALLNEGTQDYLSNEVETIVLKPRLLVEKSVDKDVIGENHEELCYALRVSNVGAKGSIARSVVLSDVLTPDTVDKGLKILPSTIKISDAKGNPVGTVLSSSDTSYTVSLGDMGTSDIYIITYTASAKDVSCGESGEKTFLNNVAVADADNTESVSDEAEVAVIIIACEIKKTTIGVTTAGYRSLPGEANIDNTATGSKELYKYNVDFRSTSNDWADEFVVEVPLEAVAANQIRVEELWTPIVWGDDNELMNVWYQTNETTDTAYSSVFAANRDKTNPGNPDKTMRIDNSGWQLWAEDLATTKRTRLKVCDLGLQDDEYLTALRLEYGRVKKGFTSKNTHDWAPNSYDRFFVGEAAEAVGLAPLSYLVYCPYPLNKYDAISGDETVISNSASAHITRNTVLKDDCSDEVETRLVDSFSHPMSRESFTGNEDGSLKSIANPSAHDLGNSGDNTNWLLWLVMILIAACLLRTYTQDLTPEKAGR